MRLASSAGGMSTDRRLANGVLAPKSRAAPRAAKIAMRPLIELLCPSFAVYARVMQPLRGPHCAARRPHVHWTRWRYYFYNIKTMKSKEAIVALSALASEARLRVYRLLVKRGPEGYTPGELIARLELPAPTLSFHLKGLTNAGLVVSRREGRNLYYSPSFERVRTLVGFLTENCCSLADEACDATCQPETSAAQARKRA
jgi:ArsR family transcriptional regulator